MPSLEQNHFDYLVPRKPFLRPKEVGAVMEISESTVEKLIEMGRMPCHSFCGGKGLRNTKRVTREGVILFLLQTKTYEIKDYLGGLVGLLSKLSSTELESIRDHLPALIAQAVERQSHPQSSQRQ